MIVIICAELRNSVLEEVKADEYVFYFSKRLEILSPIDKTFSKFSLKKFLEKISTLDKVLIEIPEPLFVRFWFKGFIVAWIGKIFCKIKGIKVCVVSYAIENLTYTERCTIPILDKFPKLNLFFAKLLASAISFTSKITINFVGFGTDASMKNYSERKFFRDKTFQFLSTEFLNPCECMTKSNMKRNLVLFLGEKGERKSTDSTYDAFRALAQQHHNWEFKMIGPGIDEYLTPELPNFSISGPVSRSDIHYFLRLSKYVVLVSKQVPRWKEQIGLPLLEGLQHFSHVFCTKDTGLYRGENTESCITWLESPTTECIIDSITTAILLQKDLRFELATMDFPSVLYFRKTVKEKFTANHSAIF